MKQLFSKVLLAVLFVSTCGVPAYADDNDEIEFELNKKENKHNLPHRNLTGVGDSTAVIGVYNPTNSVLTLQSFVNLNLVNIEVYKNGDYITEKTEFVEAGDAVEVNLAGSGAGEYEVIIGKNEEEELSGSFSVE